MSIFGVYRKYMKNLLRKIIANHELAQKLIERVAFNVEPSSKILVFSFNLLDNS